MYSVVVEIDIDAIVIVSVIVAVTIESLAAGIGPPALDIVELLRVVAVGEDEEAEICCAATSECLSTLVDDVLAPGVFVVVGMAVWVEEACPA